MSATKKYEDWMTAKWRPMMAMTYMMINIFDFIIFPILFTVVQLWGGPIPNEAFKQWEPMTLQYGGLIHLAFGAILGITAWTRGQEKVEVLRNNKYNRSDKNNNKNEEGETCP